MIIIGLICLFYGFVGTGREQRIFMNNHFSDPSTMSTGSPQGHVLSAFLFIMYTDDCRSSQKDSQFVKFSDITVLLSLLQGSASDYRSVSDFVSWCNNNFLDMSQTPRNLLIIKAINLQLGGTTFTVKMLKRSPHTSI